MQMSRERVGVKGSAVCVDGDGEEWKLVEDVREGASDISPSRGASRWWYSDVVTTGGSSMLIFC